MIEYSQMISSQKRHSAVRMNLRMMMIGWAGGEWPRLEELLEMALLLHMAVRYIRHCGRRKGFPSEAAVVLRTSQLRPTEAWLLERHRCELLQLMLRKSLVLR